jgi:hypothetical protein
VDAAPPGWTTVGVDTSADWKPYRPSPTPPPRPSKPRVAVQTTVTTPVVATPPVVRHSAVAVHHAAVVDRHARHAAPRTSLQSPAPQSGVLAATRSTTQGAYPSLLVVAALCAAIACFVTAAAPRRQVHSRGAAFIAERRLDVTSAGIVCLLAAALLYLASR